MKKIIFWLHNARYISLPQSLLPALLATCMAMQTTTFSLLSAVTALFGVIFAHLGANLSDDYFDYKKNKELIQQQNNPSLSPIRKGKCSYLISGAASEKALIKAIILLFSLSLICASILFISRGIIILYYIFITGFLSISYSGFPLRLSYHGLGEIIIGIIFGPLLMSGVYFAATGGFSSGVWILSICIGLLVANILYVHSVMDYEADKTANKKTLAVMVKHRNSRLIIASLFSFSPYILVAYGIFKHYLTCYYWIVCLLFPLSFMLFYMLVDYVKKPQKKYQPHWWMGTMEQWASIQQAGIDQFMLRWFLARNLCVYFCIITAILCFLT